MGYNTTSKVKEQSGKGGREAVSRIKNIIGAKKMKKEAKKAGRHR
jgi:hypothetical protein